MGLTGARPFRFMYTGAGTSAWNMAADEAVMTSIREGHSTPALRIYKWDPPTITIGYFQSIEDVDLERCREENVGWVRRLTGGRAVLHDQELTYSILFTAEDFEPFAKKDIFMLIARCLVDSLKELGIDSRITAKSRGDLKSANCFAAPAQFEVESVMEGKLIGSAQVIRDRVMLQHGAIPLTGSYTRIGRYLRCDAPFNKQATSLEQIAGRSISEQELLTALRTGFQKHFPMSDGEMNEYETELAKKLSAEKYSTTEWNNKR